MKYFWTLLLVLPLLSACNKDEPELPCYQVVKDDYIETITVNGNIEAVNTTYIKSPDMYLSTIIWVEEDGKMVRKGDTICVLEHPDLIANVETSKEEKEKMESELEKLEADHFVKIAMLQAEIENNKIQLSINSLDSIQKRFAPDLQKKLISLEQQKAAILQQKLERKYSAQKTIGETEIRGLQSRIKQMDNRIDKQRAELDQLLILAPKDGLLMREELPRIMFMTGQGMGSLGGKVQEGSTTWSNMNILQIPELEKMQVIAELTENNYKRVKEGQKVQLVVEAKNNLETTGVIKRKMLTGRQHSRDSKVKMYEALVEIDSCHLQMSPGMNARCNIVVNEFKDTIVIPTVAVSEEDDKKFVYLKIDRKFKRTPIDIGYMNGSYTVIKSGLSGNDLIALSKPPKAFILKEKKRKPEQDVLPADSLSPELQDSDTIQYSNRLNTIHNE